VTLRVFSVSLGAPAADSVQNFAGYSVSLIFPVQAANVPANTAASFSCAIDGAACSMTPFKSVDLSTTQLKLAVGIPLSTAAGSHQLQIITTLLGVPQTSQFPFNVVDFSGSLSSGSMTLKPGGFSSVTVTVIPAGSFMGNVQLSCSTPIACSFSARPRYRSQPKPRNRR
jgi:hypothetical protein